MEKAAGKISKFIWIVITTVLCITLILLVTAAGFSIAAVFAASEKLANVSEVYIPEPEKEKSSYIYCTDKATGEDKLIYKVTPYTGNAKKEIDISTLPEHVRMAFVSIEDERFYSHEGIDLFTTSAAMVKEILRTAGFITTEEVTGGSTITQQLVKNITSDNEFSVDRKIREISRAVSLETHYTKDQILEKYLNIIYFGQTESGYNMYGVEAAAAGYFGKHAKDLTAAEAACLAAVIQNPELRNPLGGNERNRDRQLYCLRKMFEAGYISPESFEKARKEKMNFVHPGDEADVKISEISEDFKNPDVTSWAVDAALEEFCDFICEYKNLSYEDGMKEFMGGGYEIYLTIDEDIQNELERNMADLTYFPEEMACYTDDDGNEQWENVDAAAVVMDYFGEIKGICGGIGEKPSSFCWSNATDACRQPGSTIKPLAAYCYGIENNLINWSTFLVDSPLPAGVADENEWPANYNNKYTGKSYPVYTFLAESYNTGSAQLCNMFGVENVFDFACNTMRLDLDPETDITYAAVGVGATGAGPSLVNLTNAYMPFGNGGIWHKAHIVRRIGDSFSERVYLENDSWKGERVISEETAFIMRKMLREVVENGTGKKAALQNKKLCGKTGTTENYRDILFAGLTEDYVSSVWIGYDNGINSQALKDASSPEIWKNVFGNYADTVDSGASFPECENVKISAYCAETGKQSSKRCPWGGKGYYKADQPDTCKKSHPVPVLKASASPAPVTSTVSESALPVTSAVPEATVPVTSPAAETTVPAAEPAP